jgi:hypothetical protein
MTLVATTPYPLLHRGGESYCPLRGGIPLPSSAEGGLANIGQSPAPSLGGRPLSLTVFQRPYRAKRASRLYL